MYGFMDGNDGIGFMKWPVWYFSGRGFFHCHWVQLVEESCGLYAGGARQQGSMCERRCEGEFSISMINGWRIGL